MKVILQQSEQDCLLACYSMILSHHGLKTSPGELRDWQPLPPDGLSLGFLRLLNAKYGMDMKARKVDRDWITRDQLRQVRGPMIAHWLGCHFVIIERFGPRDVAVIDPAMGKMRFSYDDFWRLFSDVLVQLTPNDNFTRSVEAKARTARPLGSLLSGKAAGLLATSVVLTQLLTLGVAAGTRMLFDLGPPPVLTVVLALGVAALLIGASFGIRCLGLQKGSDHFEEQYTSRLFSGLLSQRLSYFAGQSVGAISEKLNLRFVLKNSLVVSILPSVLSVLSLVLTLGYLILVSPPLATLLVCGSIAYFLLTLFLTNKQMEASQTQVQAQVEMSAEVQATLNNIDAVKATGTEDFHQERWLNHNRRVNDEYKRVLRWTSLAAGVQSGYTTIMLVLIVAVGLWLTAAGHLMIADIVLFQTGMALFTAAVSEAQGVVQQVANVAVYRDKQQDLFHTAPSFGTLEMAGMPGAILAKSLSFGYPGRAPVCNSVDLQVRPGEKVAVFGPSGAGKSSLLYVLLGLNDFSGTLQVGDASFREETGVLFPKMTLVEGTVRDNLLLGNPREVPDDELYDVLRDVNLATTVDALPAHLDSRVQAGGRNFSTGQAQRLLLARAVVRGRQFLFLDEAVSSLDDANRRHFYEQVVRGDRYRNVTMVMVSHDPSLADYCDTAWVITDRETFDILPATGRAELGPLDGPGEVLQEAVPRRALI